MDLTKKIDIIDGWQVRPSGDGGFGVYDYHGMVAGPFGTREMAIRAATYLPRAASANHNEGLPELRDVEPGSDADAVDP